METLDERLQREIASTGEGPVLVLGIPWPDSPQVEVVLEVPGRDALPTASRRYRLAIAVQVLEHLAPEESAAVLAALRDLECRRLLVAVPAAPDPQRHACLWDRPQMLAHGLDALGEVTSGSERLSLYGFDIDRYKRTPDWLNPRGWANPELWGKYRW